MIILDLYKKCRQFVLKNRLTGQESLKAIMDRWDKLAILCGFLAIGAFRETLAIRASENGDGPLFMMAVIFTSGLIFSAFWFFLKKEKLK